MGWDGHSTGPGPAEPFPAGTHAYTVSATFLRVHDRHDGRRGQGDDDDRDDERGKVKVIDRTTPFQGSITVLPAPDPRVTVSSPASGTVTSASSITILGEVAGCPPFELMVQGSPAAISGASFLHEVSLVEGETTIALVLTDGRGRTVEESLSVFRDSVSPVVTLNPEDGAFLPDSTPALVVTSL